MHAANVGILGERDQGQDVRTNNVTAVMAVANIVKTSLGPQGLDKMLVDDIGDVTITNDGATILKQLEVEHPAAKVIVELSQLQDQEVGDGTTSVVILAAELLKRANDLIKNKVHPTTIISGYKQAARESCQYIRNTLAVKVDTLNQEHLINVAKTAMSSKIIGAQSNHFAQLAVEAISSVKTDLGKYPIKAVKILKTHGQSSNQSIFVRGYALQTMRANQQMPVKITNAKIAFLDFNLNKFRMALGVQILINDPKNLEKIRQQECDILKQRIQKIIAAGANVIITTKGIDDIANKYLIEAGCMGLRRVEKADIRKLAKASGGSVVGTLATPEGDEVFDVACLGSCNEVSEEAVGDGDFIFFKGMLKQTCASIIVRGANDMLCDEVERSIHDSLCVVKRTLESGYVVAGGGAVEIALGIKLEESARGLESKEQTAINEYSEALGIIPKTLAINAAKDATDLVSKLKVLHYASQTDNDENKIKLKYSGLDLVEGKVRNNIEKGVLEPMDSKIKSIRFATEAAITILRIDDMIKLAPAQEEMDPRQAMRGGMPGMM